MHITLGLLFGNNFDERMFYVGCLVSQGRLKCYIYRFGQWFDVSNYAIWATEVQKHSFRIDGATKVEDGEWMQFSDLIWLSYYEMWVDAEGKRVIQEEVLGIDMSQKGSTHDESGDGSIKKYKIKNDRKLSYASTKYEALQYALYLLQEEQKLLTANTLVEKIISDPLKWWPEPPGKTKLHEFFQEVLKGKFEMIEFDDDFLNKKLKLPRSTLPGSSESSSN